EARPGRTTLETKQGELNVCRDPLDAGRSEEATLLPRGSRRFAAPARWPFPRDSRALQPAQPALRAARAQGQGGEVAPPRRAAVGAGSVLAALARHRAGPRAGGR